MPYLNVYLVFFTAANGAHLPVCYASESASVVSKPSAADVINARSGSRWVCRLSCATRRTTEEAQWRAAKNIRWRGWLAK